MGTIGMQHTSKHLVSFTATTVAPAGQRLRLLVSPSNSPGAVSSHFAKGLYDRS